MKPQPFGPKVWNNLREAIEFKISLRNSSPNIQLGPVAELVLLWPDNSCFILHLDEEDMITLRDFINSN